jgi:hypothetical protein
VTRRTPQQWIRDLDQNVIVDSVIVHGGQVIYREQRPNRTGPGAVTFSDIDAVATPVRRVEGRRSRRAPMIFTVKAMLQRVGRLDVRFRVPLDAPTYDLAFRGALGSMPATAFNEFLERVYPWRIERGRVQRIHFDANIQNGVATGTVTPLYTDLSIKVTGRGADGLLGTGGVVGDAARGVASLVANWTEFNERNPAESGKPPRSGAIADTFTRRETLPALVWRSLRGGLLAVVRKEDK